MYLNLSSCLPYPLNEHVLDFRPSPEPYRPRFRYSYSDKVRVDRWCCKSGRHQTIGPPPRDLRPEPCNFLKKHSRQPPVFFDSEELKSHTKPIKPKKKNKPPPPRRNRIIMSQRNPARFPSACPHHQHQQAIPRNMGLFRHPDDPPYEIMYRSNRVNARSGPCRNCGTTQVPLCNCANRCERGNGHRCDRPNRNSIPTSQACGCGNCCNTKPNCSQRHPATNACRSAGAYKNPLRRPRYNYKERVCGQENAPEVVKICLQPKFYVDEKGAYTFDLRPTGQCNCSNCKEKEGPFVLKPEYGQVPEYLEKRKEELRTEQKEEQVDEAIRDMRDSKRNSYEEEANTSSQYAQTGFQGPCCCAGVYLHSCNCAEKGCQTPSEPLDQEPRKSRNSEEMKEPKRPSNYDKERRRSSNYDEKERRPSNYETERRRSSNYDETERRKSSNSGEMKTKRSRFSGSHLMDLKERQALIKEIQETRDKFNQEYMQLLSEDSNGTAADQTKLEQVESKIKNCEKDLKILSSPNDVYVKTTIEGDQEVHLFHL